MLNFRASKSQDQLDHVESYTCLDSRSFARPIVFITAHAILLAASMTIRILEFHRRFYLVFESRSKSAKKKEEEKRDANDSELVASRHVHASTARTLPFKDIQILAERYSKVNKYNSCSLVYLPRDLSHT